MARGVAAGLARFLGVAPARQTAAPGGRAGPGLPGVLPPQQAALLRPRTWSGPGTPGRPGATSAARSAHDRLHRQPAPAAL